MWVALVQERDYHVIPYNFSNPSTNGILTCLAYLVSLSVMISTNPLALKHIKKLRLISNAIN